MSRRVCGGRRLPTFMCEVSRHVTSHHVSRLVSSRRLTDGTTHTTAFGYCGGTKRSQSFRVRVPFGWTVRIDDDRTGEFPFQYAATTMLQIDGLRLHD